MNGEYWEANLRSTLVTLMVSLGSTEEVANKKVDASFDLEASGPSLKNGSITISLLRELERVRVSRDLFPERRNTAYQNSVS